MKKLFAIPILILLLAFTVPVANDLDYAMCDFVAIGRAKIEARTGMKSDGVFWTAHEQSGAGTIRRYAESLQAGNKYVYYGITEGSDIRLCVAPLKGRRVMSVKPDLCSKSGKKVSLAFTADLNDDYIFFIETVRGEAIHLSYLTVLIK